MWPFFSNRDKNQTDAEAFSDIARFTARRGPGLVNMLVSLTALIFSAYSVFQTTLKQPDLRVFVPPVIRYAQPYSNSNFEVFAVPVTIANSGARTGTVLSLELTVSDPEKKLTKQFYSADFGSWTMDQANAQSFKPFAPMVLLGHGTQTESILFYARREEKVQAIVSAPGTFQFTLKLNVALADSYWLLDHLFSRPTMPLTFQMTLPEMDHRAFTKGTLQMHTPDWQAVSGG